MAVPKLPVEPAEHRVRNRLPAEDPHHLRALWHAVFTRENVEEAIERILRDPQVDLVLRRPDVRDRERHTRLLSVEREEVLHAILDDRTAEAPAHLPHVG